MEPEVGIKFGIYNNIAKVINSQNTESKTAFLDPILSPIFNPKVLKKFNSRSEHGIKK